MEIDKSKFKTLNETDEQAPMDAANDRVEAEMKLLESEAKAQVAQGLQDDKLAREAERLRKEAEKELEDIAEGNS
jgi:hypothetical protein